MLRSWAACLGVGVAKKTKTAEQVPPAGDPRRDALIASIKVNYPQYAFLFDETDNGFGDDLRELLLKAAMDPEYTADRFNREKLGTRYYKETSDSVLAWNKKSPAQQKSEVDTKFADIQSTYGDLFDFEGGDKVALAIAQSVASMGMTGNRLKNFVYAEVMRLKPAGVKGPTGTVRPTLQVDAAAALKNVVREYGYTPSDDEIQSVLTGTPDRKGMVLNQSALIERAKNAAKGMYPHLKDQLDAGLSLDDIFKNYKQYAAVTLELDPNQIDFTKDPKWSDAFGTADTGPLSLSAWQAKLKTDPKYGWKFTNQANKEVSNVVSTLERAFGLVK